MLAFAYPVIFLLPLALLVVGIVLVSIFTTDVSAPPRREPTTDD